MNGKDALRRENAKLRLENLSLHSKVREQEDTIAACAAAGLRLRDVLATYHRGDEPDEQDYLAAVDGPDGP